MSDPKLRARDLRVPFEGTPGKFNAITDVAGVEVGHSTLIKGQGALQVGQGPVRAGVTAILPRGKESDSPVFAGWFSLNGNGEMTGTAWIDESGLLECPILLTNTSSVGTVRDAVIAWAVARGRYRDRWVLPVVAETWDGYLNDSHGFHIKQEHVFQAIEGAQSGAVEEGNVGSGTGMICYRFKGGIGTASRVIEVSQGRYTVGALVQANFGQRHQLRIAGVPVGRELAQHILPERESGSIIIIVATDAPLLPHQLKAVAKRAGLGMARTGGIGGNSSGDLFLAFSTGNLEGANLSENVSVAMLGANSIDPLYEATIQATEEAIINALTAAETMTGINNRTVFALSQDRLQELLLKYNVNQPI